CGVQACSHLGKLMTDGAKLRYREVELYTLVGVADSLCNDRSRGANSGRTELDPTYVQDIDGYLKAISAFGKHILHRNRTVIEENLPCGRCFYAELMFFGVHCNPAEFLRDNKCAKILVVFYFCKDNEDIRKPGIGDPHFLSIKQVMCSFRVERCRRSS